MNTLLDQNQSHVPHDDRVRLFPLLCRVHSRRLLFRNLLNTAILLSLYTATSQTAYAADSATSPISNNPINSRTDNSTNTTTTTRTTTTNSRTSNANASTGYKVHLQDADIKAFIDQVASITNKNFVLDPRINGNVTVISNKALSRAEIYDLFLGVMKVNGIVAIDRGNITELIPDTVAKQAGIDVDLRGNSTGAKLTTRIFYLTNTNANDVLTIVRPLIPQYGNAAVLPNINALILSDRADSLNEIAKLIRDLDSNMNDRLVVIPLQHVDAQKMVELLSSLTGTSSGTTSPVPQASGAVAPTSGRVGSSGLLNIVADASGDRLLVKGSPEMIAKVQDMVAQLDTVPSRRLGGLKVFRLKYASAVHIADMLRGLLANQSINSAGDPTTLQASSMFDGTSNSTSSNTTTNAPTASPTGAPLNTSSLNTSTNRNGNSSDSRPFSIIADQTQNAVIVNANPDLMGEIEQAIAQLDTRRDQVLIQAAIIEISGSDTQQLGVQWALGSANSGVGVVNFSNVGANVVGLAGEVLRKTPGTAAGAIAGALLGVGNSRINSSGNREFYGAILQAINKTENANLLSMPSILTLDNEKANILVGQNVPFVTGSYTTSGNSSTNPFQTIDRKDVGINLNVIPHIGENGSVRLEVSQEVSSIVNGTLNSVSGVVTNKNLIKTTILADNQQTVALGGLMRDNSTYGQEKVPGLGDVPFFGNLFKSKNKNSDKTNLIVFLQPTILNNGTAIASMTEKTYEGVRTLQLVIDKNGTLKKLPISMQNIYPNSEQNRPVVETPQNDLLQPAGQKLKITPTTLPSPASESTNNGNIIVPVETMPTSLNSRNVAVQSTNQTIPDSSTVVVKLPIPVTSTTTGQTATPPIRVIQP